MFIKRLVAVCCGGFFGGIIRETIELCLQTKMPMGTFIINVTGCFMSAAMVVLLAHRWTNLSQITVDFIMVGILGAYTTYSTAVLEIVKLGSIFPAAVYIIVSIVGGVLAVFLGRLVAWRLVSDR